MSLDLCLLPRVGAQFLALSAEIPMWRPSCHLAADEKALLRLLKVNSSGFSLLTSKPSTICKLNCQLLFIPLNTTFCRLIQPFRLLQLAMAWGQRCVSARGAKEELSLMMSGRQNWQRIICKTSLEMCHSHMTTLKSCRSASTMVTCEEGEEVEVSWIIVSGVLLLLLLFHMQRVISKTLHHCCGWSKLQLVLHDMSQINWMVKVCQG